MLREAALCRAADRFEEETAMRVIVISDTHRDFRTLYQIVKKHREEAALCLHPSEQEGNARWTPEVLQFCPFLGR